MQPLNQAERRKTFFNFLTFFTITITIIIVTVCFGMQVPIQENGKIKPKIKTYQNNEAFAMEYSARIKELQDLLDNFGSPNTSTEYTYSLIESKLTDLQRFKDSALYTKENLINGSDSVYGQTLHALSDLASAKYNLTKSGTQLETQAKLSQDNDHLNRRINDANNYIIRLAAKAGAPPPQPF